jgi:DNA polymerase (family X)
MLQADRLDGMRASTRDGRLEQVPGFGHRRAATVRAVLANMLGRVRRNPLARSEVPGIVLLLDVDREYRQRAAAEELVKIAPKPTLQCLPSSRFNPKGEAWLPLLHTMRGGWHFTALYSNTALAPQLRAD